MPVYNFSVQFIMQGHTEYTKPVTTTSGMRYSILNQHNDDNLCSQHLVSWRSLIVHSESVSQSPSTEYGIQSTYSSVSTLDLWGDACGSDPLTGCHRCITSQPGLSKRNILRIWSSSVMGSVHADVLRRS